MCAIEIDSSQSALHNLVDPELLQLIYTDGSVGTVQQGHNAAHTDAAQADADSQMRATCPGEDAKRSSAGCWSWHISAK
jgi:hypothetical protein